MIKNGCKWQIKCINCALLVHKQSVSHTLMIIPKWIYHRKDGNIYKIQT